MRRLAVHLAAEQVDALVGHHHLHARGFTHDAAFGADAAFQQIGQHVGRARAAHFFVIREGQVDWLLARHGQKFRHQRQRAGDETLHVARAAAIQQAVFFDELERVRGPILAIHGHHVSVARQNDTALLVAVLRRQRGEQVGLGALGIVRQPRIDALALEPIADGFDQGKIGIAAGGVETHQRFQPGARVHVTSLLLGKTEV
ncbi:Uncharacterised protein [Achromobacter kerstersii]|nr:Uncharacterised protein [Achromobacter kerstersii]